MGSPVTPPDKMNIEFPVKLHHSFELESDASKYFDHEDYRVSLCAYASSVWEKQTREVGHCHLWLDSYGETISEAMNQGSKRFRLNQFMLTPAKKLKSKARFNETRVDEAITEEGEGVDEGERRVPREEPTSQHTSQKRSLDDTSVYYSANNTKVDIENTSRIVNDDQPYVAAEVEEEEMEILADTVTAMIPAGDGPPRSEIDATETIEATGFVARHATDATETIDLSAHTTRHAVDTTEVLNTTQTFAHSSDHMARPSSVKTNKLNFVGIPKKSFAIELPFSQMNHSQSSANERERRSILASRMQKLNTGSSKQAVESKAESKAERKQPTEAATEAAAERAEKADKLERAEKADKVEKQTAPTQPSSSQIVASQALKESEERIRKENIKKQREEKRLAKKLQEETELEQKRIEIERARREREIQAAENIKAMKAAKSSLMKTSTSAAGSMRSASALSTSSTGGVRPKMKGGVTAPTASSLAAKSSLAAQKKTVPPRHAVQTTPKPGHVKAMVSAFSSSKASQIPKAAQTPAHTGVLPSPSKAAPAAAHGTLKAPPTPVYTKAAPTPLQSRLVPPPASHSKTQVAPTPHTRLGAPQVKANSSAALSNTSTGAPANTSASAAPSKTPLAPGHSHSSIPPKSAPALKVVPKTGTSVASQAGTGHSSKAASPARSTHAPSSHKVLTNSTNTHTTKIGTVKSQKSAEKMSAQQFTISIKSQSHLMPASLATPKPSHAPVELESPDSAYSDDDEDEHRKKYAKYPAWTQTPELMAQLRRQAHINPDNIFGAKVPALNLEDVFPEKGNEFRERGSSADWEGPDGLSAEEIKTYNRRMGYEDAGSPLPMLKFEPRESM